MVERELAAERSRVRALGRQHFIPFSPRPARFQAFLSLLAGCVEGRGFPGLDQQMRGAGNDQFAKVIGSGRWRRGSSVEGRERRAFPSLLLPFAPSAPPSP